MKNKLTYQEIEELIPDYVLDKLDNSLKIDFEECIKQYDDLLTEVQNAKQTFELFEKFDLKATIKQESKNLSRKVKEKPYKKQITSPFLTYLPKYVYPSLGLLVIVYLLFFGDPKKINKEETNNKIFYNNEVVEKFDEENVIDYLTDNNLFNDDYSLELENYNDLINIDDNSINVYYYEKFQYDEFLNNIDEKEFLIILKELKDEKIDV